jgi:hypothetical protein
MWYKCILRIKLIFIVGWRGDKSIITMNKAFSLLDFTDVISRLCYQ